MRSSSRLARLLVIPLLFLFLAPAFAAEPVWMGVERVVAVGDLHGNYNQFVKCLLAAKVIDDKGDWIAGKTHLVQTGDVNDRGPDTRKCFDLLMKLEVQARKAGGMVHPLLGNHEFALFGGDSPDATTEEIQGFGGPEAYHVAFTPRSRYGKWLRTHDIVIKINDVLYVHAGLTPEFSPYSLDQINKAVRKHLTTRRLNGIAAEAEGIEGPLRTDYLHYADESDVAQTLDLVFKTFGARHMVVGHAIAPSGIATRAAGRLIRIDVGMSRVTGAPAACLVIDKGVFYEARFPDTITPLDLTVKSPARPGWSRTP